MAGATKALSKKGGRAEEEPIARRYARDYYCERRKGTNAVFLSFKALEF